MKNEMSRMKSLAFDRLLGHYDEHSSLIGYKMIDYELKDNDIKLLEINDDISFTKGQHRFTELWSLINVLEMPKSFVREFLGSYVGKYSYFDNYNIVMPYSTYIYSLLNKMNRKISNIFILIASLGMTMLKGIFAVQPSSLKQYIST